MRAALLLISMIANTNRPEMAGAFCQSIQSMLRTTIRYCQTILFVLLQACAGDGALAQDGNTGLHLNFNDHWRFTRLESSAPATPAIRAKGLYDSNRTDFSSQFLNEYVRVSGAASVDVVRAELRAAQEAHAREYPAIAAKAWQDVTLPHSATIEPIGGPTWQGVSYYRKTFAVPVAWREKRIVIEFEGAMQQSDVWLNGRLVRQHKGGYTPFSADLSAMLAYGKDNELVVRLDNHAGADFPPGKDLQKNGYTYWSGLYRSVRLHVGNWVHISDAVMADQPGGGGVFFRTPEVGAERARAIVKTHVVNQGDATATLAVRQTLLDATGATVLEQLSAAHVVNRGGDVHIVQEFTLDRPALWHPDHPSLYTLRTSLLAGGKAVDQIEQKVGFRHLAFDAKAGFSINGQPLYLVGTNRHQDYPYIGVALSKQSQYRDMLKIKQAGYNAVRLAHYPQDPAVYEAADELGLMLIDCIPGWQFFNNNEIFKQRALRDIRDMIHRDRNHPSIILWEANLNESYPADEFRMLSHQLAHEELPAGEYFTTGETYGAKHTTWDVPMNNWYESPDGVFRDTTERRQDVQPGSPSIIKEYADWEFGGPSSTTRSSRASGEQAMLQGLWNTLWHHNADRANHASTVGDFTWAMYDNYISGDDRVLEWGTADYFRLPKFTSYLFPSQADPAKAPFLFIANWWAPGSAKRKVVVLGNTETVVLKVNGRKVGEQGPDHGPDTPYGKAESGGRPFDGGNASHLAHPPTTFNDVPFEAGELTAQGFVGGVLVAEAVVRTPTVPVALRIAADVGGKAFEADGADAIFVHVALVDANGTVACLDNTSVVNLQVDRGARIVGPGSVKVHGGIASFLVQSASRLPGAVRLRASSDHVKPGLAQVSME
jgi:beta-galactosidase